MDQSLIINATLPDVRQQILLCRSLPMSIDEYANTRWVVCEHCGSELRVWYTPDPAASPPKEIECPACRRGISLDVRAQIESVQVMPRESAFGSRKSSDKSRRSSVADRGLVSSLCDAFLGRFRKEDR